MENEKKENNKDTLRKTIQSSKWVALGSVSDQVLGVISFLLLARFLEPVSYGLIAVALMVVGVFNRMLVTGFETAVIQRKGNTDKYLDAVWTFNFIKGFVVFVIIFIFAPLIAELFHAEDALAIIRLSGLFVLIPALTNIKQLYLFKDFKFNILYLRNLLGQVGYVLVGFVYAVFISADVWALFYANLSKYIISSVVVYIYFFEIPKFNFNFYLLKDLISYSKWITAQNFVNYVLQIVDNIFIARFLSPQILGLYSKARNLSATAISPFSGMIKNLGLVAFSKVQDEKEKIKTGYLLSLDFIVFLGLSNMFFIWFAGEAIVAIVLGDHWLGMLPALKIFSAFAITNTLVALIYSLFDGAGKPRINFKLKVVSVVLYTIFAYVGIKYKSMVGVALGVTFSSFLIMLYATYKIGRVYNIRISEQIVRFINVAVPMSLISLMFLPLYMRELSYLLNIALVGIYYFGFLGFMWFIGKKMNLSFYSSFSNVINILLKKL